jgi:hypothetical protein
LQRNSTHKHDRRFISEKPFQKNHATNLLVGCRQTAILQMDFLIPRLSAVIVAPEWLGYDKSLRT